ncbi:AGAP008271-PA-like protein [Anopheles sinensis]|uniref:AGAP008271-PA-like protein n=1 Tax=Anopheles sinensis TaxID=74873 RepID=A0A084W4V3_ANOSI|nr:AGAP008271-PA-like protein [Anopheles sinensis]
MLCVFESCSTNKQSRRKNIKDGVQFIPFPTTDYSNEELRRLAKKRLHWWCRIAGVDYTDTLLNQLHVCSLHFVKGTAAQLWDTFSPDWIPTLSIPVGTVNRLHPLPGESCDDFIKSEQHSEETIANPLLDETPDPIALRTELIDELIAYPIGRTYHLLNDESETASATPYDVKNLANTLKGCLTRTSNVGRMVFETNAPHVPERMFSGNSSITSVDLSTEPRWETERNIMKLQNSVLGLIAMFDENE